MDHVLGAIQYAPEHHELLGAPVVLPALSEAEGSAAKDLPRRAEQVLSSPQMAIRYAREGPLEGEVRAIRKS